MADEPREPSLELAAELLAKVDAACEEAASVIRQADVLLLCVGAGFSSDSGLPTYGEIASVEAYRSGGIQYHDLCKPQLLRDDPELFWGFWGTCFNKYRRTEPHEGYEIINRWVEERFRHSPTAEAIRSETKFLQPSGYDWVLSELEPYSVADQAGAFFAITSNVDAHLFDWFPACEIRECHGNIELYQCAKAKARACPGVWRAPTAGFSFQVDAATKRAHQGPAANELVEADAPERRSAPLRQLPEGLGKVDSNGFGSNHPQCRYCQGPARPAILMFDDTDWQDVLPQLQRKQRWLHAVLNLIGLQNGKLSVAILEIGAGGNVTTVRNSSEQILRGCLSAGAEARLVRVNPELPLGDEDDFAPGGRLQDHVLSVMSRGLPALQKMDASMKAAVGRGLVAAACGAEVATPLSTEEWLAA